MYMIIWFIVGLCFGSFFCLVAERVPQGGSIMRPASHCGQCQTPLHWSEMIPIFSILIQGFRCKHCQVPLPKLYLVAELVCGLLFISCFSQSWAITDPWSLASLTRSFWLLSTFLLALADIFYFVVEPKIFYPSAAILTGLQLLTGNFQPLTLVYCALICGLSLLFYREKFGLGDCLVLLVWSPWLTLHQFSLLLLIASLTGLVFFAMAFLIGRKLEKLPFLPFLAWGLFWILH